MSPASSLPEGEFKDCLERQAHRLAELDRRVHRLELFLPLERGVPAFQPKDLPEPVQARLPDARDTPVAVRLIEMPAPPLEQASEPPALPAPPPVQPVAAIEPIRPPQRPPRKPAPAFLSEAEFHQKLTASEAQSEPAAPPKVRESWEVRLATVWLPRVAGVLILVGAAIGATLLQQQLGAVVRVALGYALTIGLVGGGWFVRRRHELLGRLTMAIGLAVGYFVSFAAHYIEPMNVLPASMSILLMLGFVGTLAGLAERWNSQGVAISWDMSPKLGSFQAFKNFFISMLSAFIIVL